MSAHSPLTSAILVSFGPVHLTRPVVTTWVLMAVLAGLAAFLGRRLAPVPGRGQIMLEAILTVAEDQIRDVMRLDPRPYLPLIVTLFLFLATANLSGLVPGFQAPTATLETPAALALIVLFAVQMFGIRAHGIAGYLAEFLKPSPVMLPLNLIEEVTRTFSLMVRLFGNVMSGEFVIALVLALAGLFVPVPLMALELLLGLVQAFIFTILATVFIGAAVQGGLAGGGAGNGEKAAS